MTALALGDHNNPAVSSPGLNWRSSTPCVAERPKTKLGNAQIVPQQGNIVAGAGSLTRFLR
jgi:hypothetical protein